MIVFPLFTILIEEKRDREKGGIEKKKDMYKAALFHTFSFCLNKSVSSPTSHHKTKSLHNVNFSYTLDPEHLINQSHIHVLPSLLAYFYVITQEILR